MNTRRFVSSLIVVQTACMVCGLAFFYLYVHSAVRHEIKQRLYSCFLNRAKQLSAAVDTTLIADPQRLRALLAPSHAANELLLLVDREGNVTFDPAEAPAGPKGGTPKASKRPIVWVKSSGPWGCADAPLRGLIQGESNVLAAVAHPLDAAGGYVLLAAAIDDQPVSLAALRPTLRMAACLALVWTIGLSVAAIFLLTSHFRLPRARTTVADVESLKSSQALMRTQESVIFGLAKLSDSRDSDTGDHLERISYYCTTLAASLRMHPDFRNEITPTFVRLIGISSALHDIGKVGVEDAILRKPGPLTLEERELMARHTRIGEECLREIEHRLGTSNYLQMAREIAASHHERWDGTGYPQGLAGDAIPLAARIVAIADVYDALSSKRVYKLPLAHEQCVATIAAEAGKHFDPRLVCVFLEIEDRFRNINHQLQPSDAGGDISGFPEPLSGELAELAAASFS